MAHKPAADTIGGHARAATSGGRWNGGLTVEHDLFGDCLAPVYTDTYGRESESAVTGKVTRSNLTIRWVRCRKCERCLRARSRHWAARCQEELDFPGRHWFWTLTSSPAYDLRFCYKAKKEFPDMKYLERAYSAEITKMFKRMRKAGHRFRYFLASERHPGDGPKHGHVHYHIMLHEDPRGVPVSSRLLTGNQKEGLAPRYWPFGVCHARLIRTEGTRRAAWYACKYISKEAGIRVRASVGYGRLGQTI